MSKGDHVRVHRGAYWHHGIDAGDGTVVHFTGEIFDSGNATIDRTPLDAFLLGGKLAIVKYARTLPVEEVIRRAESRLGERGYSVLFRNCEHFATWAKLGDDDSRSEQIDTVATSSAGTAAAGAATAAGLGIVSAGGTVAGLSGSGIMSGLAAAGGVVGGGAVAGLGVLGAGPIAITTLAMNRVLRDDDRLADEERSARAVGRAATVTGAIGGSMASVAAVSTAGVAGLSGAGITSGLSAIGATVGGGMAAGTVLTVAAPAAAAVGYGAYRAACWLLGSR